METLTLGQGHRKGQVVKNRVVQVEKHYIDFVVSGQSLGQVFGLPDFDLIGIFGWTDNKEFENKKVDEFLGFVIPELATGRTCFYVCPECGDTGCGAITAAIEVTDKQVVWKDFGYENNYSQPDLTDYKQIGPFTFDKTQYFATLEGLKTLRQLNPPNQFKP